jgi:hypothetical protein
MNQPLQMVNMVTVDEADEAQVQDQQAAQPPVKPNTAPAPIRRKSSA